MYYTVEPTWKDEACIILACGPSVASQDLSLLSGNRVIAINDAWKLYPNADVLFSGDWRFFKNNPDLSGYTGPMIACVSPESFASIPDNRKVHIGRGPRRGLTYDRTKVAGQYTCVGQAANFAFHRGCNKIILVGVDLGPGKNGNRYAISEEKVDKSVLATYDDMRSNLQYLGAAARSAKIAIRVVGVHSRVVGIPKFKDLKSALECPIVLSRKTTVIVRKPVWARSR
jgi:hypothetical protein